MGNKIDILVAEDDAVLRSLYEKKFSMAGYDVRSAADGEEAIKRIDEKAPDVLLLDIHMPKVDGFEVMRHYPRQNRTFPIVLLTNFGEAEFKLKALELGADDYFVKKDMTIRSLIEMTKKLLENRK